MLYVCEPISVIGNISNKTPEPHQLKSIYASLYNIRVNNILGKSYQNISKQEVKYI